VRSLHGYYLRVFKWQNVRFFQSAYHLLGFNVNRNSLSSCASILLLPPYIFVLNIRPLAQPGRPFFGSIEVLNLILKKW